MAHAALTRIWATSSVFLNIPFGPIFFQVAAKVNHARNGSFIFETDKRIQDARMPIAIIPDPPPYARLEAYNNPKSTPL